MITALILILLALALVTALAWRRAARKEAVYEAAYPPEGQILNIDGVKVHAVVMGDGPDLVLIHGTGGNTRDMTLSLAPRLAERYRVIVLDRPGNGYTDMIRTRGDTIEDQARLLARAATALGADRPIVLGHSYGGSVALAWAVYVPDQISALVPLAAASNPWTTPLDRIYALNSSWVGSVFLVPLMTAHTPQDRITDAITGIFAPQPAPDGFAEATGVPLTLRRTCLRSTALQRAHLLDEITAMAAHYNTLDLPVEIVHGREDQVVSCAIHSDPLAEQIPGAHYTPLEGIGHMPHHVEQDTVVAAIDRAAERAGLR
ncbi:MAG: alpha/beta hydrolase [Pseudomonadota bacterium]